MDMNHITPDYDARMPMPSLVVTDVDGTFLRPDHTISALTRDVLAQMRASGVRFALASGRPVVGLQRLLARLDLDPTGVILMGQNGSEVCDATTGEVIMDRPIPQVDYRRLIDHVSGFRVTVMVPSAGRLYVDDPEGYNLQAELAANGEELAVLPDLRELPTKPYKVLLAAPAEYLSLEHQRISAPLQDGFEFAFSVPYYYEATRLGTNKGTALAEFCTMQQIPLEQVIAFGDNHNDVAMLATAGTGVAMLNGVPQAKAAAAAVTRHSNGDDGLARFLIDHLGL